MRAVKKAVSWLEIALGAGLVTLSASLFVFDWLEPLVCSTEVYLECWSWTVLVGGLFVGIPTLIVGAASLKFPRVFWFGQVAQLVLVCYILAIALADY